MSEVFKKSEGIKVAKFINVGSLGEVQNLDGHVMPQHQFDDGHVYVPVVLENRVHWKRVCDLIADAHVIPVDGKPHVGHIDGDPTNNVASNIAFLDYDEFKAAEAAAMASLVAGVSMESVPEDGALDEVPEEDESSDEV